ncbi:MAG: ATP-binding protein [Clostridia bacterium]|nr:ATP-binding protein [Clostridia bacterium]
MSYTKKIIDKADEIITARKNRAESIQQVRHTEIVTKIPAVAQYESQLSSCGFDILKAIGMGENAEEYIKELSEMNLKTQEHIREELVKAGYPEDYLEPPYTCKKCGDSGTVGGYYCECRKELLAQLNLQELYAVSPAENCRFDNFSLDYYSDDPDDVYGISAKVRMQSILEYCRCYAEDFDLDSGSLYLHGSTGLGKTHLSLAIANVVAAKGYNIIYNSAYNIFSALEKEKFSYSNTGEEEAKVLNCDLLIIDDLGSEFSSQYSKDALYNIINTRVNTGRPVIISTNLTENELETKYSQRVTSRIIGNYTSLLFVGKDIRQIKNDN